MPVVHVAPDPLPRGITSIVRDKLLLVLTFVAAVAVPALPPPPWMRWRLSHRLQRASRRLLIKGRGSGRGEPRRLRCHSTGRLRGHCHGSSTPPPPPRVCALPPRVCRPQAIPLALASLARSRLACCSSAVGWPAPASLYVRQSIARYVPGPSDRPLPAAGPLRSNSKA